MEGVRSKIELQLLVFKLMKVRLALRFAGLFFMQVRM